MDVPFLHFKLNNTFHFALRSNMITVVEFIGPLHPIIRGKQKLSYTMISWASVQTLSFALDANSIELQFHQGLASQRWYSRNIPRLGVQK
jgi:hypothetical protein